MYFVVTSVLCGLKAVATRMYYTENKKKTKQSKAKRRKAKQQQYHNALVRPPLRRCQFSLGSSRHFATAASVSSLSLSGFIHTHNTLTHTRTLRTAFCLLFAAIKRKENSHSHTRTQSRQSNVNAISQCPCHYKNTASARSRRRRQHRSRGVAGQVISP